jgi:hypothetical protein
MGGPKTVNSAANYGIQGIAVTDNVPGARVAEVIWSDRIGNLWLFGGRGYDSTGTVGLLNDLWSYSQTTQQWTWIGGSNTILATEVPGTQGVAAPGNVPGARSGGVSWSDSAGNFWMFGGASSLTTLGYSNELWMYSPSTGLDLGGENQFAGVYGTQGIAAVDNILPARVGMTPWTDRSGNFWVFGGEGVGAELNDLWMFSPTTRQWTWEGFATSALGLQLKDRIEDLSSFEHSLCLSAASGRDPVACAAWHTDRGVGRAVYDEAQSLRVKAHVMKIGWWIGVEHPDGWWHCYPKFPRDWIKGIGRL